MGCTGFLLQHENGKVFFQIFDLPRAYLEFYMIIVPDVVESPKKKIGKTVAMLN